jgi:cytochrome c
MHRLRNALLGAAGLMSVVATRASSAGDAEKGAALFRACAACHSLTPDRNMTGPSLAGIWERKAGSLASFDRYSPALKSSDIIWDENSLDAWLKLPQSLVPQNRMIFPGISDAQQCADLLAFMKAAGTGQAAEPAMASGFQDLKKLGADRQVKAIRYCHATYHVTTADGQTADFWEANLRFKTDSGETGPLPGRPVMLPAGMMGDRTSVFFASPDEISSFIKHQC